jgi:hypothetical protein
MTDTSFQNTGIIIGFCEPFGCNFRRVIGYVGFALPFPAGTAAEGVRWNNLFCQFRRSVQVFPASDA